ncbi:MAG: murein biosynthesis integral membrane protein MurJ [Carboxydocellales bacterium]
MQASKPAARSVGKVILATMASKAMGFLRETVIAAVFGASRLTDAYLVAATLPGMLFSGFQNALQTTVVPVFNEVLTKGGKKEAFAMVNSLINLVLLISLAFMAVGMLAVPWVVAILAPGFEPEIQGLAVKLARIMFPLIIFWVLTGIMSGILNSFDEFTIPALIGVPYNLIIIVAVFTLGSYFGIYGLAWGTLLAVAGQLVFLLPSFYRIGPRFRCALDFRNPGVVKIVRLSVPVLLSAVLTQVMVLVDRVLGSGLEAGSIAALSFADRINALALGLFAVSIATVMYPALAKDIAAGELEEFKGKVSTGITVVSYIILPVAVALLGLAEPIIQVIYQRGAFGTRATELTTTALRYYALGTLAVAIRIYLEKVYYSLKDSLTPMLLGSFSLILNIVLSLVLVRYLALGGLALGVSLAQTVYVFAAFWVLKKRDFLSTGPLLKSGIKILLASAGMAVVLYWGGLLFRPLFPRIFAAQLGYIALTGGLGLVSYLLISLLLKAPEPLRIWNSVWGSKGAK